MLPHPHQRVSLCHSVTLVVCDLHCHHGCPWGAEISPFHREPAIRGLDCVKLIHNHTALRAFYPAASSSPLKRPTIGVFTSCLLKGFLCSLPSLSFSLFLSASTFHPLYFSPSRCPSPFCLDVMPIGVSRHGHCNPLPRPALCLSLSLSHPHTHTHLWPPHLCFWLLSSAIHQSKMAKMAKEKERKWRREAGTERGGSVEMCRWRDECVVRCFRSRADLTQQVLQSGIIQYSLTSVSLCTGLSLFHQSTLYMEKDNKWFAHCYIIYTMQDTLYYTAALPAL